MNSPIVVSTVVSAAVSYNLTDLATTKDELGLTSDDTTNDAWLSRAIGQVSRSIMTETNRVFVPECVRDVIDIRRHRSQVPGGVGQIQLSRWPVIGVASVIQSLTETDTTLALVEGVDFRVNADDGMLLRLNADSGRVTAWEALPLAVTYTAGYGSLVEETQMVPGTPFKVTVSKRGDYSCDQSVTYSDGTFLTLVQGAPAVGQYSQSQGVYTFNAADAGELLGFAYATTDIPEDLEEITLRLVTGRYQNKGREPNLIEFAQPTIGTKRWWFGAAPGQSGPFPPDIAGALDAYRVPVAA